MRHRTTPPQFPMIDTGFPLIRIGFLPLLLSCALIGGCANLPEVQADTPRCPDSVQAKVSVAKQHVRISYTEPSVTVENTPLTHLLKTSIYYDLGTGRILAKDIPATQPSGGQQVSETITIPVTSQQEQLVRICVTATDRDGHESMATP